MVWTNQQRYTISTHLSGNPAMVIKNTDLTQKITEEIKRTPPEHRGYLLEIVRAFRESVTLPTARDAFRQGWKDAKEGNTHAVHTLWDGIDSR
jgi:hypothetical protein